jgi:LuxR family maltose regulon positive regulatory protein
MWVVSVVELLHDPTHEARTATDIGGEQPPIVRDELVALQARSLRLAGRFTEARRLLHATPSNSARIATERIAVALDAGDLHSARGALADVTAGTDLNLRTEAESLALAAVFAHQDNRPNDARHLVGKVLDRAELQGLAHPLLGIGPAFISLIETFADPGALFARLLLVKSTTSIEKSANDDPAVQLTRRERELLRHLPTRLSNVDLAALYSVSVNTVKTHLAHIYQKLGTPNRDGAITRARELGLLEQ